MNLDSHCCSSSSFFLGGRGGKVDGTKQQLATQEACLVLAFWSAANIPQMSLVFLGSVSMDRRDTVPVGWPVAGLRFVPVQWFFIGWTVIFGPGVASPTVFVFFFVYINSWVFS